MSRVTRATAAVGEGRPALTRAAPVEESGATFALKIAAALSSAAHPPIRPHDAERATADDLDREFGAPEHGVAFDGVAEAPQRALYVEIERTLELGRAPGIGLAAPERLELPRGPARRLDSDPTAERAPPGLAPETRPWESRGPDRTGARVPVELETASPREGRDAHRDLGLASKCGLGAAPDPHHREPSLESGTRQRGPGEGVAPAADRGAPRVPNCDPVPAESQPRLSEAMRIDLEVRSDGAGARQSADHGRESLPPRSSDRADASNGERSRERDPRSRAAATRSEPRASRERASSRPTATGPSPEGRAAEATAVPGLAPSGGSPLGAPMRAPVPLTLVHAAPEGLPGDDAELPATRYLVELTAPDRALVRVDHAELGAIEVEVRSDTGAIDVEMVAQSVGTAIAIRASEDDLRAAFRARGAELRALRVVTRRRSEHTPEPREEER